MDGHFTRIEQARVLPVDFWPLRGGALCLDFANTVGWRPAERPVDAFREYGDLIAWGCHAGMLSESESERLRVRAVANKRGAMETLLRAVALREAIYRLFAALAHDREPDDEDLRRIDAVQAEGLTHSALVRDGDGFAFRGVPEEDHLAAPLWKVAESATKLLISGEWRRVRECPGHDCGWLFLDTTKNGNRRWCDSADCGNRARVRAHAQRQRAAVG